MNILAPSTAQAPARVYLDVLDFAAPVRRSLGQFRALSASLVPTSVAHDVVNALAGSAIAQARAEQEKGSAAVAACRDMALIRSLDDAEGWAK